MGAGPSACVPSIYGIKAQPHHLLGSARSIRYSWGGGKWGKQSQRCSCILFLSCPVWGRRGGIPKKIELKKKVDNLSWKVPPVEWHTIKISDLHLKKKILISVPWKKKSNSLFFSIRSICLGCIASSGCGWWFFFFIANSHIHSHYFFNQSDFRVTWAH